MEIIPFLILSRDIVERTPSAKRLGICIGWIDMLSKIDTSKINLILKANLHLLTNFGSFLK